jgi:hypothetical protein
MKYIVNENNSCGAASISDTARNNLLESLGHAPNVEAPAEAINESVSAPSEVADNDDMPSLYSWDDAVFALDEEVFEIEGDLFLKAIELDSGTCMMLGEAHAELFINEVRFEEAPFSLGDIYDFGNEIFIKLDEGKKKGDKSADKDKDDDKGDFETGARKGDKSKTHAGKDFDKDDEKGDPRAFGGKKGDKSKTHGGKDFEVNEVATKLKKLKKKLKEDDEDGPSNADLDKIEKQQKKDGTY